MELIPYTLQLVQRYVGGLGVDYSCVYMATKFCRPVTEREMGKGM